MPNLGQKLPFSRAVNKVGEDRANADQEVQSKAVPCTVTAVNKSFVTVKLEMKGNSVSLPTITIPQAYSEWTREPTQVGDKGLAIPSDYYMGAQTGQGGGTADLYPRANLTNLVFRHASQKSFSAWDGTKHFLNGPNGVVLQSKDGTVKLDIDKASGSITITGNLKVTGNITASSGNPMTAVDMLNHVHTNVQPGSGMTGVPQTGT